MSNNPTDETILQPTGRSVDRFVSAVVALAALEGVRCLANAVLDVATATDAAIPREHAPALLNLPVLAAPATAVVCDIRRLGTRAQVKTIELGADGEGATILNWALVFSALVIALRALW